LPSERRWLIVCVGRCGAKVAEAVGLADFAAAVVLSAFGGDAVGAVLLSGAASSRHHRGSLTAVVSARAGFQ
jgi:bifunctional ADP-heptose synthase (sugar kinase/adenylyltransferase)